MSAPHIYDVVIISYSENPLHTEDISDEICS
jgi:hypothetical protein